MIGSRWLALLGNFLALALLVGALAFLQVSNAEKDLLFCLPAYSILACATLLALLANRSGFQVNSICLGASLVFCGYIAIRALLSPANYAARPDLYSLLAAVTLYGLTLTVLSTSRWRITLILSLLAFAIVHVLVSVIQAGWGENLMLVSSLENVEQSSRATGLYVNPDHLAGLLEVLGIFGLSITCWSRRPRWLKVVTAYLTAACYLGLALTGSRGGYLSAVTSLILFALLSLIALRAAGTSLLFRFGGGGLILLLIALLSIGFILQQKASLKDRAATLFNDEGRRDLWQAALQQWKLQPVLGTGSGTYRFYGRQFRAERMQSDPVDVHNDYLHLLCEYGLLGAAAFLLFLVAHLRQGWRSFVHLGPKRLAADCLLFSDRFALALGGLCAIGAYIVHSAVDFNLHIPANALLMAFVFGLIAQPGGDAQSVSQPHPAIALPKFVLASLGAILLFQSARLYPGEHYAERARAALRDEEPASAISFAEEALKHERKNPHIFFYLGRALVASGNAEGRTAEERRSFYTEALAAFDRARQLVPLDGTYPLEMAFCLDSLGKFNQAAQMYQLALARDPRSAAVTQRYQAHLAAWKNADTPEKK